MQIIRNIIIKDFLYTVTIYKRTTQIKNSIFRNKNLVLISFSDILV